MVDTAIDTPETKTPKETNTLKKKSWVMHQFSRVSKAAFRGLFRVMYGAKIHGLENFKGLEGKPTLIVANHVNYMDSMLLGAMLPNSPAFAIKTETYNEWSKKLFGKFLFSIIDVFPIDPANPRAIRDMTKLAKAGQPVMIFPEGRLTRTGTIMQIFDGAAAIADNADAHIVPVHLDGFEFLPYGEPQTTNHPRRWFPKLTLTVQEPRKLDLPDGLKRKELKKQRSQQLQDIMYELPLAAVKKSDTLISQLHKAAENFGMDREILDDPEETGMTYKDLLTGAYALGAQMDKTTEQGEMVGFLLPNSRGAAAAFWALQAYGRVPAMLNPKAGAAVTLSCTETACLKTIITSKRFVKMADLEKDIEMLKSSGREIVYLEDLREKIGPFSKVAARMKAKNSLIRPSHPVTGEDPAVVLFTSGSEGVPKGVALSSKNILSNVAQVKSVTAFAPSDKVFNAMPLFHAFGLTGGLVIPMLSGMRSFQYPSPLDGKNIPKAVYHNDSTIMFGTDTFLNLYTRNAEAPDFSQLKMIFAGAERLKPETYDTYVNRFGVRPNQGYGMTEASPVVTINTATAHEKNTVGRFLPGIERRLEPVEGINQGKQLYIRGPNVMLGYLKHDKPGIIQKPENGWHDTGDIININPEGYVSIAGRAGRFAKIGGEMVALDAVEIIAKSASPKPEYEHGIVLQRNPEKGDTLALFTTDPALKREHLTKAAQESHKSILGLPKDPDIHFVPDIPKLSTGKMDYVALKKRLEQMNAQESTIPEPTKAPSNLGEDFSNTKDAAPVPQKTPVPQSPKTDGGKPPEQRL